MESETMTLEQQLIELGWEGLQTVEGNFFHKLAEGLPNYFFNETCPSLSINISGGQNTSISLQAVTKDDQWVRLESYGIPIGELLSVLDRECERLKKAWIAVCGEDE